MVKAAGFCYKILFSGLIQIEIDFIVVFYRLQITKEFYESSCFNGFEANGAQGRA